MGSSSRSRNADIYLFKRKKNPSFWAVFLGILLFSTTYFLKAKAIFGKYFARVTYGTWNLRDEEERRNSIETTVTNS